MALKPEKQERLVNPFLDIASSRFNDIRRKGGAINSKVITPLIIQKQHRSPMLFLFSLLVCQGVK